MLRFRFFLGTAGIALALISGCGSAQSPGTGTGQAAAGGSDPAVVWNEFVACARVNGQQNWPDPQVKPDGKATFGDFPVKPALESVREKCGAILQKLPPAAQPGGGQQGPLPPPTEAHMKAMNEYTKCMRENGFDDWPDVHADGTFWLDDAFWTRERRAKQAIADPHCRHLLPEN